MDKKTKEEYFKEIERFKLDLLNYGDRKISEIIDGLERTVHPICKICTGKGYKAQKVGKKTEECSYEQAVERGGYEGARTPIFYTVEVDDVQNIPCDICKGKGWVKEEDDFNLINSPYICEYKGKKFSPSKIDYENKLVWYETENTWINFNEFIFIENPSFNKISSIIKEKNK